MEQIERKSLHVAFITRALNQNPRPMITSSDELRTLRSVMTLRAASIAPPTLEVEGDVDDSELEQKYEQRNSN